MKQPITTKILRIACLALWLWGCGSAAEFDSSSSEFDTTEAGDEQARRTYAVYNAIYDAEAGALDFVPVHSLSEISHALFLGVDPDYLAKTYNFSNDIVIPPSQQTIEGYDVGNNGFLVYRNKGLCLQRGVIAVPSIDAAQLRFWNPSLSTVTFGDGTVPCAFNASAKCVDYQNMAGAGLSYCRGWGQTESSGASYTYQVYVDGTDGTGAPMYILNAAASNSHNFLSFPTAGSTTLTITGLGFGGAVSPTVKIIGTTTCTLSPFTFSDVSITVTINAALTATCFPGYVQVTNNTTAKAVSGPFVKQPTQLTASLALGSGTVSNKTIWIRLKTTAGACPTIVNGCPPAGFGDGLTIANATLSTVPTSILVDNVAVTGKSCNYFAIDTNGNGILGNGDTSTYDAVGITFATAQNLSQSATLSTTVSSAAGCP